METTLRYLKNTGVTLIAIPNLDMIDDELICNNDNVKYDAQHYSYMNINEFVEFLYGIINDGLIMDIDNFRVHTMVENVTPKGTEILFNHKYKMIKVNTKCVITGKTLASILSNEQINYLRDEHAKYLLNKSIKALESKIQHFIDTQSSFDDISEFKRALEILHA